MAQLDKVNVLLVDDQPAKLLAYEVILKDLNENLVKATSAREALEHLLKKDVAIVLIDVCMPELDGFELAAMIREHPRFQQTAIIFVSAIHLTQGDILRGFEMGAVDYVPVPVVPEVLRAKVKVFAELYRKTRQLEQLNRDLERRVAERTADLEASHARLVESERRRSLALAAGQMGSWDWDVESGQCVWDEGQYRIFGIDPKSFELNFSNIQSFIHPEDLARILALVREGPDLQPTFQTEVRIVRPTGQVRWCICAAAMTCDAKSRVKRVTGVTIDITDLKEAEARRTLLIREVDHRARNALALVQSIIRLTKATSIDSYVGMIEGRIRALSTAHALLSESRWEGADLGRLVDEELAPYRQGEFEKIASTGPAVFLQPTVAQIIALVLHELVTNAAKYGALSHPSGRIAVSWQYRQDELTLEWEESGGPAVQPPTTKGYGTKVINASVIQQLGGNVDFNWRPHGLRYIMGAPIGAIQTSKDARTKRPAATNGHVEPNPNGLPGQRLLLVEDEALVGMMMKDTLTELGFSVLGPFGHIMDAMHAARQEKFDGAVLDINVKGEMIYDLADAIAAREIPLIFVTGYGSEAIEERFRQVPVLQKPVDKAALKRVLLSGAGGGWRADPIAAAAISNPRA
jgi:PAS domain S-box-containing protein